MPAPAGTKRVKIVIMTTTASRKRAATRRRNAQARAARLAAEVEEALEIIDIPRDELNPVQGKSVYRPFIYGSSAVLLSTDPAKRPPGTAPDHTHQWTVYVRGVDGADITYWLKKVQFKLHETYAQSQRMIEAPTAFEVTETGWGEFEIGIKLFFHPDSGEKSQSIYHQLKLHHFGDDKEEAKKRGDPVISQLYEEVVFNEPAQEFFNTLTTDPAANAQAKAGSKSAKAKKIRSRNAEIPERNSKDGYTLSAEQAEIMKLREAQKVVNTLIAEEKSRLAEREKELADLKKLETATSINA